MPPRSLHALALAATLGVGCRGVIQDQPRDGSVTTTHPPATDAGPPPFVPEPPVMPRLTAAQYRNATTDLLGAPLPAVALEADTNPFLFTSIGAAQGTASERGVQAWESAALTLTAAVFDDGARRAALLGCTPTAAATDACVRGFLTRFGRRAFRRPLEAAELDQYAGIAARLGASDPWQGVRYAVAALLQSPNFLYRVEVGVADPAEPEHRRYTSWEMASRLAFLLWDSAPDDALLDAAARDALATADGVRTEARRMLDSPRARAAVRHFFAQYLSLGTLDNLSRDPTLYPQMSETIAAAMRTEVERMAEDVVFTRDVDFRAIFTTRVTYLDPELAALYGVAYPTGATGFARVTLPENGDRAGLLTTGAILALTSHPNATSPTGRGRFIRERLLCERVPDPPMNVSLNLDDGADAGPRTLRERLERHRRDPACAACHRLTDPVGLGFENFDAIGARRLMEAGRPVDSAGDLDGAPFNGARALGALLEHDERVTRCVVKQLYRFASSRLDTPAERYVLQDLSTRFAAGGYRFRVLLEELAASDGFRYTAAP